MRSVHRLARSGSWSLALALSCTVGCVDATAPDPDHAWRDGDRGEAQVVVGDQRITVEFVVEGGRAIAEGDIDLGPVAAVMRTTWAGGAIAGLGNRWPSTTIPYTVVPANSPNGPRVDAALAEISRVSAFTFVKTANPVGDYLVYRDDFGRTAGTGTSAVGYGGGAHDVRMGRNGSALMSVPTLWHETMHALGWFHESARPDRDAFVDIDPTCYGAGNSGDYALNNGALTLGLYDYASTMHYASGQWCLSTPATVDASEPADGMPDCTCLPIVREGASNVVRDAQFIGGCGHSREDVNSLWWLYPRANLTAQAGSRFASALAMADFDHDGYDDVAVGIPGHDVGATLDTGLVEIFRGTSRRPVAWKTLVPTEAGGTIGVESDDRFGSALVAGDLDGDGNADLIVGVPGEDLGAAANAGMIQVFLGCNEVASGCGYVEPTCQHGLRWAMDLSEVNITGQVANTGERFGAALAIADTDGDGRKEIVVGAPGELHPTTGVASGAAFVIETAFGPSGPSATLIGVLRHGLLGTADPGDGFGTAIAAGAMDTAAGDDLIVGSPEVGTGSGAVYLFKGTTTGPIGIQELRGPSPATGDRFGAAVAVGALGTGSASFVIGAPGRSGSRGAAYQGMAINVANLASGVGIAQTYVQVAGDDEPGDELGAAVAIGNVRGTPSSTAEVVVGIPGEDSGAGRVVIYNGGAQQSVAKSSSFLHVSGAGDRFGAALALGNVDGVGVKDAAGNTMSSDAVASAAMLSIRDLVVGAPLDTPETLVPAWTGPAQAGTFSLFLGGTNVTAQRAYDRGTVQRD